MVYTDSASIKAVQTAINAAGYQPALVVDGISGPKTVAGVRWFQQQHGLTVNGLIGPATMAATIAPTPAQAASVPVNPLASVATQISQLMGAPPSVPSTPAPLATTPVTSMPAAPSMASSVASALGLSSPAAPAAARPGAPAAMAYRVPTKASALSGNIGGIPMPALLGAALGAGFGALAGLVWALAGAAGGGAVGYGLATILPGATMHGEDDIDFCLEYDYGCDEPTIVAGEIGCETKASSLLA